MATRTRRRTRSVHNAGVLCLLGPPAIATGGNLDRLELRPKALALLARLALTGEPQTRAELLFWEAANPRDSLRWHLSYLRARLPGVLTHARVVVADLTGRNPNVFYELGIAHQQVKPVIQLAQRLADVPFDVRHLRTVIYRWRVDSDDETTL